MLVEKSDRPILAGLIAKNSEFYIELAKFVQAYTTIINHPNLFLREIAEPNIAEGEKLTWKQMSKILQKCDFGFATPPTDMELLVFYNYALEIGSVDSIEKKVASIEEVSDAQKTYYNFVDEAKDKAEEKYYNARHAKKINDTEISYINSKLAKINSIKFLAFFAMIFAVIVFTFCGISFVFENNLSRLIGSVFKFENGNILALLILMFLSIIIFLLFDKMYVKQSKKFQMLYRASETIFSTISDTTRQEAILKRKLSILENELKIIQAELDSETNEFDVKQNINNLVKTNKYYKELYSPESTMQKNLKIDQSEFEPVILSKVELSNSEDLESGVILEEGQFDTEAYNQQFERSRKSLKDEHEKQIFGDKKLLNEEQIVEESKEEQDQNKNKLSDTQKINEEIKRQQREIELNEKNTQESELIDSIEYIKSILGMEDDDKEYEK